MLAVTKLSICVIRLSRKWRFYGGVSFVQSIVIYDFVLCIVNFDLEFLPRIISKKVFQIVPVKELDRLINIFHLKNIDSFAINLTRSSITSNIEYNTSLLREKKCENIFHSTRRFSRLNFQNAQTAWVFPGKLQKPENWKTLPAYTLSSYLKPGSFLIKKYYDSYVWKSARSRCSFPASFSLSGVVFVVTSLLESC